MWFGRCPAAAAHKTARPPQNFARKPRHVLRRAEIDIAAHPPPAACPRSASPPAAVGHRAHALDRGQHGSRTRVQLQPMVPPRLPSSRAAATVSRARPVQAVRVLVDRHHGNHAIWRISARGVDRLLGLVERGQSSPPPADRLTPGPLDQPRICSANAARASSRARSSPAAPDGRPAAPPAGHQGACPPAVRNLAHGLAGQLPPPPG